MDLNQVRQLIALGRTKTPTAQVATEKLLSSLNAAINRARKKTKGDPDKKEYHKKVAKLVVKDSTFQKALELAITRISRVPKPKKKKLTKGEGKRGEKLAKELRRLKREERKLIKEAKGRKGGVELRKVQKRIQELGG